MAALQNLGKEAGIALLMDLRELLEVGMTGLEVESGVVMTTEATSEHHLCSRPTTWQTGIGSAAGPAQTIKLYMIQPDNSHDN